MSINNIINKLNNELDKLNNQTVDTNSFFTDNENFNNDFSFDDTVLPDNEKHSESIELSEDSNNTYGIYDNIEPDNETKSLVTTKEHRLLVAQNMFKKSIRVSLKSFLISLTLSFLNLFI